MRISTNAETHNLADEETPEEQKNFWYLELLLMKKLPRN